MSDQQCPVCKKDGYIDPDIKIYISPCYHKLCSTCINRLFPTDGPCPQCGAILKRMNFFVQTFEDLEVEKECRIRKMLRYQSISDFQNEEEYNEYLEKMEDFIFELVKLKNEEIAKRINSIDMPRKRNKIKEAFDPFDGLHDEIDKIMEEIDKWDIYENGGKSNKDILLKKAIMSVYDDLI